MKIVVNVDDYGFTKSEVDGVIYAYQNGVVTSTSCLANVSDENLEYAALKAKENPGLAINCHLVLTAGNSLTKGKTICKPDGSFYGNNDVDYTKMDREEVYQEFKAQIERFIKFFGKKPQSLDSHHRRYAIMDTINMKEIIYRLTEEYGIHKGRDFNDDVYYAGCLYNEFTVDNFKALAAEAYHSGIACIEIACHVAFVDEELYKKTSYTYQRIQELKAVTCKEMLDFYSEYKIEKATY